MGRMPKQNTTNHSNRKLAALTELNAGLKALAHPSRIEIIRQLALRDRCCAGDFCDCLPLAQSTISQHLEMLCSSGLVKSQASGTKSIFTLNPDSLMLLANALIELAKTPCCAADNALDEPGKQ